MTALPWRLRHSFGDFYVLVDAREQYVSDACVEGHADEWRDIVRALRARDRTHHKRCAVKFEEDGTALFYSPRNTMGRSARLPAGEVTALADMIERVLVEPVEGESFGEDDGA